MTPLVKLTDSGADISEDGVFRYLLWRQWKRVGFLRDSFREATCLFIMLNPSTADGKEDDPTVRRCMGFAQMWGYHRLEVVNLFAYRATDPKQLLKVPFSPIGPHNDTVIYDAAERASIIICAWGQNGWIDDRANIVKKSLKPFKQKMHALGFTRGNHPKHPLYLPTNAELEAMR